jgi:phosphate transport system substrate-binding protein
MRERVAHTAGGIGYTSLPYFNSSVRTVAIDGVTESLQNITAGRYIFWTYEHLYTLGQGSRAIAAFLDFMLTTDAQRAARQVKFIAMADMKLPGVGTINGGTGFSSPRIALHESERSYYA